MGPLKSCNGGGGLCQAGPQHCTEQPSAQRPLHDVDMLTKNRGEHPAHLSQQHAAPPSRHMPLGACNVSATLSPDPPTFCQVIICHLTRQPFVRSTFCHLTCQSIRHPLGAQLAARGPSFTHFAGRSLHSLCWAFPALTLLGVPCARHKFTADRLCECARRQRNILGDMMPKTTASERLCYHVLLPKTD